MPSTFRFTHLPHFLHFFSLTYGPVVVIDFDLIIVLFSLFGGFLVWLSADRLLSAPSNLSQFVLLLFLFLFMLLLMSCAWKSFYFSPWLLSGCLLMDCWVPRLSPLPGLKTQMHNVSIQQSTLENKHIVSMQFNNNCSMQMHTLNERKYEIRLKCWSDKPIWPGPQ